MAKAGNINGNEENKSMASKANIENISVISKNQWQSMAK
jgi:hypothetical protein